MLRIISVGKIKDNNLQILITDYQKRLSVFGGLDIIEAPDFPELSDLNKTLKKEELEILKRINPKDFVVLLDLQGENISSEVFALKLQDWLSHSFNNIVFIIGGSNGVSQEIKKRANYLWQFSKLTFPHQLIRLMLVEQIYRAYKINNNQKYHK